MRNWLLSGMAVLAAAATYGQSFNIDFNVDSGAGSGVPLSTFGGAAGQDGGWTNVAASSPLTNSLSNIQGVPTAVTLTRTNGQFVSWSNSSTNGSIEDLIEDVHTTNSNGQSLQYTFSGLQAGKYVVFTYAINANNPFETSNVSVTGSTSQAVQTIGGQVSTNALEPRTTHAIHVVQVAAGGSIVVNVAPPTALLKPVCGGLQIKLLTSSVWRTYVNDNAVGENSGGSWTDAFTNPMPALESASLAGGQNCEVWVANGFYEPTEGLDREASFVIPSHLKFFGGFSGTETTLSQRPLVPLTYLNGNIGGSGSSDNSYTVVTADNTASDTRIDGFRIHNGYNNSDDTDGNGGGMRLVGGNARVQNCTFVDCEASNYGGGVYVSGGAPTFIDCLFYQDEAFSGSALYHTGGNFSLRMYNCEFLDNNTFEGTVHVEDADGTLANCWFHGNYAGGRGGALDIDGASSAVTIANCTIVGNYAGQEVGGVMVRGGADADMRNSILWENDANFGNTTLEKQYDTSGAGSTIVTAANTAQGASGSPGLDPMFVDGDGADNVWGTFDDDCHLLEQSPAVDLAGVDNVPFDSADLDHDGNTSERLPIDFDGNPRIVNVVVDKGAFEYMPEADTLGDMNCDGVVSVGDIAGFVLALTNPAGYATQYPNCNMLNGDINGNGVITVTDIGPFVAMLTGN